MNDSLTRSGGDPHVAGRALQEGVQREHEEEAELNLQATPLVHLGGDSCAITLALPIWTWSMCRAHPEGLYPLSGHMV